jgi:hypothetical protein
MPPPPLRSQTGRFGGPRPVWAARTARPGALPGDSDARKVPPGPNSDAVRVPGLNQIPPGPNSDGGPLARAGTRWRVRRPRRGRRRQRRRRNHGGGGRVRAAGALRRRHGQGRRARPRLRRRRPSGRPAAGPSSGAGRRSAGHTRGAGRVWGGRAEGTARAGRRRPGSRGSLKVCLACRKSMRMYPM